MHSFLRSAIVLVALGQSACGVMHTVPTDPNHYNIKPETVTHLRASQSVALKNAYPAEASVSLPMPYSQSLVVEQKQLTETAIAILGRALEKQGIAKSGQTEKTITLRVRARGYTSQPFRWTGKIILEAQLGDSTVISYPQENLSGHSMGRAFDGAVLFALNDLLADEKFIAYMNR